MRKIIYYSIIIFLVITSHSLAQKGSIEGIITDDNGPIPGVNVFLMNTSIGGISDSEGFYKITNIPTGEYEIRYSAVGYKSKFIMQDIVVKAKFCLLQQKLVYLEYENTRKDKATIYRIA